MIFEAALDGILDELVESDVIILSSADSLRSPTSSAGKVWLLPNHVFARKLGMSASAASKGFGQGGLVEPALTEWREATLTESRSEVAAFHPTGFAGEASLEWCEPAHDLLKGGALMGGYPSERISATASWIACSGTPWAISLRLNSSTVLSLAR